MLIERARTEVNGEEGWRENKREQERCQPLAFHSSSSSRAEEERKLEKIRKRRELRVNTDHGIWLVVLTVEPM